MRVYEIQPSGAIEPVTAQAGTNNTADADAALQQVPAQANTAATADNTTAGSIAAATLAKEGTAPVPPQQSRPEPEPSSSTEQAAAPTASNQTADEQTQVADQGGLERTAPSGSWVVQVASFPNEQDALAMAEQLGEAYEVFYTAAQIKGDTWYRVRIGPFDTGAAAKNAAAELRAQGRDTLVVHVD